MTEEAGEYGRRKPAKDKPKHGEEPSTTEKIERAAQAIEARKSHLPLPAADAPGPDKPVQRPPDPETLPLPMQIEPRESVPAARPFGQAQGLRPFPAGTAEFGEDAFPPSELEAAKATAQGTTDPPAAYSMGRIGDVSVRAAQFGARRVFMGAPDLCAALFFPEVGGLRETTTHFFTELGRAVEAGDSVAAHMVEDLLEGLVARGDPPTLRSLQTLGQITGRCVFTRCPECKRLLVGPLSDPPKPVQCEFCRTKFTYDLAPTGFRKVRAAVPSIGG
jgi:hypothetical protein